MDKLLYKITVIVLKILPMLLAFITLLNSILSYFNIDLVILSYIGGVSLIPMLFIYVASYTFKFCEYHRMFLHYIVVTWIINIIDLLEEMTTSLVDSNEFDYSIFHIGNGKVTMSLFNQKITLTTSDIDLLKSMFNN